MKCPLMTFQTWRGGDVWELIASNCLKEECGWWDVNSNGCSVYLISRSLMSIFDVGVNIKEQMPTKASFAR